MDDEHATEILSCIFFSSADYTVRSAHIIQHFCLFKQIEHAVLFIKNCILFRLIYQLQYLVLILRKLSYNFIIIIIILLNVLACYT